jgi:hypothetical protein
MNGNDNVSKYFNLDMRPKPDDTLSWKDTLPDYKSIRESGIELQCLPCKGKGFAPTSAKAGIICHGCGGSGIVIEPLVPNNYNP